MDERDGRTAGLPALLAGVLAAFTAQQALAPVLAPLAREVGLAEVAIGAVMTVAAVVFTATALVWGRAVDRFGHRPVLSPGWPWRWPACSGSPPSPRPRCGAP